MPAELPGFEIPEWVTEGITCVAASPVLRVIPTRYPFTYAYDCIRRNGGAGCTPSEPHNGWWNCAYRWVARSLPDTEEATLLIDRIEWLRRNLQEKAPRWHDS